MGMRAAFVVHDRGDASHPVRGVGGDSRPRKDTRMSTFARPSNRTAYRSALALTVVAVALLVWLAVGVGIIGADGDPANALYAGVLAVGILVAAIARLEPRGMSRALLAMAAVQVLVTIIALTMGLGRPYSPPLELIGVNAIFIALFGASAWLFARAASS